MCGRFSLGADFAVVSAHFSLQHSAVLKPRYNITPGEVIPVIRSAGLLEFITWGLKPKWLKADQSPFINARMETLMEKPAFKHSFKKQRCLVIADGYYEWKQVAKLKQPYYISLPDNSVIAFAALWEADSCAIITKEANKPGLSSIHDRMPVIIESANYAAWLDPKTPATALHEIMRNANLPTLQIFPVSTKVNNPKHDFIECIKALQ